MEYNRKQAENKYFKVVLVRIKTDEHIILKGPEEEKRLAGILRDDYNTTRHEKMIRLLSEEVVQQEYRKEFSALFSMENIIKELESGKTMIEYSYIRDVENEKKMVTARVYPRKKLGDKIEEFMVYVISENLHSISWKRKS